MVKSAHGGPVAASGWLLLQLADSAFPTGAFAHSQGMEAAWQRGLLASDEDLELRLRELVVTTAHAALPFVGEAHGAADPAAVDAEQDAFLSGQVANRASRAQGRAFLLAAAATLDDPAVTALREMLPCGHLTVAMGASLARAGLDRDHARQLHLFGAVRAALSAAVRLGVTGPLAAQHLLRRLHPAMDAALEETRDLTSAEACSASPLIELVQSTQDRLYSRLFQS
jgi:urease accessory protein